MNEAISFTNTDRGKKHYFRNPYFWIREIGIIASL